MTGGSYDVDFDWEHSHGHVTRLVVDHVPRGVVLDLGCGYAPHAEPLRDEGYIHVGLDVDTEAIASLRSRGFVAEPLDLADPYAIAPALAAALGRVGTGHDVVAVLALDVIEHLVDPGGTLAVVTAWMAQRSVGVLGVSVPNVAHVEIAAKLLAGRWDVTPTGLLDHTHLRFFTDESLTAMLHGVGLVEAHRNDVVTPVTDQHWPLDHPTVEPYSAIGGLLRDVRARIDDHGATHQFVRLYELDETIDRRPSILATVPPAPSGPFLSVLVHPEAGDRTELTAALDAQTSDDFEVLVADPDAAAGDAERLDAMLDRAHGRYATVVDRFHRPEPDWVEQLVRVGRERPGSILRVGPSEAQVTHGEEHAWPALFDLSEHVTRESSPMGSVAFPVEALRTLQLGFGDVAVAGPSEAHALLLVLGTIVGVDDTQVPALSVEPGWRRPPATVSAGLADVVAALDGTPTVLGRTGVARLASTVRRLEADLDERAEELVVLREELDRLRRDNDLLNAELARTPVRVVRRLLRLVPDRLRR